MNRLLPICLILAFLSSLQLAAQDSNNPFKTTTEDTIRYELTKDEALDLVSGYVVIERLQRAVKDLERELEAAIETLQEKIEGHYQSHGLNPSDYKLDPNRGTFVEVKSDEEKDIQEEAGRQEGPGQEASQEASQEISQAESQEANRPTP